MKAKNLFLALHDKLGIYPVEEISTSVLVESRSYKRVGTGDFHGFYDWLRNSNHDLVGVRHMLFDDYDGLLKVIEKLNYAEIAEDSNGNVTLYIFFSTDRSYVDAISNDQFFVDDFIYESDDGVWGLTFRLPNDLHHLISESAR